MKWFVDVRRRGRRPFPHPLLLLLLLITACVRPDNAALPAEPLPTTPPLLLPTSTLIPTRIPPTAPPAAAATATPLLPTVTIPPSPTPLYTGAAGTRCGITMPLLPDEEAAPIADPLNPDPAALAAVRDTIPPAALPALQQLLDHPDQVALVAYRLNEPDSGIYHNADQPMPLASIVKLIHLVAYAEAVENGLIDPTSYVTLETLERYYLPNYDLRAHPNAVAELTRQGVVLDNPPRVRLEDVPFMMMRFSSNAAMDYLHDWFGQERIEETALALGLDQHTAPCSFLGQFLIMSNHTRGDISDEAAILGYAADPEAYGRDVANLAAAYNEDPAFREAEISWHQDTRRPRVRDQRLFSSLLNTRGTAGEYAALMARLAQNGLSNPESSYLARRYLEWPMIFPANQELFSNLGYKNGSLPGILNTAYYAYPLNDGVPLVVILFYKDLPQSTYRAWRNSLTHDEFARWLLANPQAIPLLRELLSVSS